MRKVNKHIGSDFDDFLRKQGTLEASTALAMKCVIAWQLAETMKARGKDEDQPCGAGSLAG